MVLAVLDAHCGLTFGGHDVYLNVAGGLKIREPAADLAVAAALVSSLCGVALPGETVYFGEASLSGSLRSVSQTEARLKEAAKLGFTGAVIAAAGSSTAPDREGPMKVEHVDNLAGLVARIAASGPRQTRVAGT